MFLKFSCEYVKQSREILFVTLRFVGYNMFGQSH